MTTPNLGRLTTVPPREVWTHEAHNFTPWVLQNVDVLSDLLGMDLVLDIAEHPVGDFSLDILGRDQSDDSVVIVENQLEQSDHLHLGQILTYAAGTNPKTVVWIATGFRPEHRAALDWLNEHTDPDTRFFGVEIEVVRIGDSAPAPNFKLAVEPNDWEKQVKAATAAGAMTEKSKLYWDFWEQFRARVVADHPGWTKRKTSTRDSWYDLATGMSGAVFSNAFTRGGLAVQMYFNDADPSTNTARFEALHAKQDQFEQALGKDAVWDEMAGRKAARVCVTSAFKDIADIDQWPAMIDWLLDQHARFRQAIQAVGGLGSLA
jgi:hypothetical protein